MNTVSDISSLSTNGRSISYQKSYTSHNSSARHGGQQPAKLRRRVHAKGEIVTQAEHFLPGADEKTHAKPFDSPAAIADQHAECDRNLRAPVPLGPTLGTLLGSVRRQEVESEDIDAAGRRLSATH